MLFRLGSRRSSPSPLWLRRVAGVVFVLAGVAMLIRGLDGVVKAQASTRWPTAPGIIQASNVDKETHTSTKHGRQRTSTTYRPSIRYAFTVKGVPRSGDRVAFGDFGTSDAKAAGSIVGRYPVGKAVTVYYQPGTADMSVLEPGVKWQTWLFPGAGAIVLLLGFLVLSQAASEADRRSLS